MCDVCPLRRPARKGEDPAVVALLIAFVAWMLVLFLIVAMCQMAADEEA
jgi:hypothetical protein